MTQATNALKFPLWVYDEIRRKMGFGHLRVDVLNEEFPDGR